VGSIGAVAGGVIFPDFTPVMTTEIIGLSACSSAPVKTGVEYYGGVQTAYDQASTGDTIQCRTAGFQGNLNLNRNIQVSIKGGYDCNYLFNGGDTKIQGSVTIRAGKVTAERITLQPPVQ
jgi:hypothetical protein